MYSQEAQNARLDRATRGYREDRPHSMSTTAMVAEIAWGDPLYGSIAESDAAIERDARRARWMRRKASK